MSQDAGLLPALLGMARQAFCLSCHRCDEESGCFPSLPLLLRLRLLLLLTRSSCLPALCPPRQDHLHLFMVTRSPSCLLTIQTLPGTTTGG